MKFILKLLGSAFSVLVTSFFLSGVTIGNNQFYVGSSEDLNHFTTALLVAIVLSFLNTIIKPILIILSLPITVFTLGFFLLVINSFIILFANKLVVGFSVDGFWTAFWFSLILSFVTSFLDLIFSPKEG
jgi:putative membrane protein